MRRTTNRRQTAEAVERLPSAVDLHVGARLRTRRKFLGMTQQELAKALSLTFQQIQKYERGANRVSASKLYELAGALRVPVSHFFEGLADPGFGDGGPPTARPDEAVKAFLFTAEGPELAALFQRLPPSRLKRQILELVRAAADDVEERGAGR